MFLSAAALVFAAAPVPAQPDVINAPELTGFVGGVLGVGSHPAVGAAVAYPTSRYLVPNVEFSYSPLDERGGIKTRLWDFNGGLHVRFPDRGIPRLTPYLGFGIGLIRIENRFPAPPFSRGADVNKFAVNLSGGARYYITDQFGVRPEIKGFLGDYSFMRASVGVFWQF